MWVSKAYRLETVAARTQRLCELVDVVGRLDLVEHGNELWAAEGRAQTDACQPKRLGQGLQHDQVGVRVDERRHAG